ncbi:MAG TPA: glycosyltransferase, partial [Candidatus Omnitrophota bacterium]|nr:glycosyltransferase [Candidatus Omnitrophota bacterium]
MTSSKPSKICFISHSSAIGGAELSLLDLIDIMTAQKWDCRVILPSHGFLEDELCQRRVSWAIFPYVNWVTKNRTRFYSSKKVPPIRNFVRAYLPIIRKIGEWNPDVIYTNTSVINCGAVAAFFLKKPHIWHVREFVREDHRLNFFWPFKEIAHHIDLHSDAVIFNSEALARKYRGFISRGKLNVIGNPVRLRKQDLKPAGKKKRVDVIVTFRDDPNIIHCLESMIKNVTPSLNKIYIIDDHGRNNSLVKELRRVMASRPELFVYKRNYVQRGYVISANKGIRLSKNDVILLNSDTVVTHHWLEKLKRVACQDRRIATVTPLSNNATIFSVLNEKNDASDAESVNSIMERTRTVECLDVPTAHGFCMYIKRMVI